MRRLYEWIGDESDPYIRILAAEKNWTGPLTERQLAELRLEAELRYQQILQPRPALPSPNGRIDRFLIADSAGAAWDTHLHRFVTLQPIPLEQARLAARLRHPFIVDVWGMGGPDSNPYLILEPLRRRDAPATLDVVAKLCRALDHAQSAGVQFERIDFTIDASGTPRLLVTELSPRVDPSRHAALLNALLPDAALASDTPRELAAEIERRQERSRKRRVRILTAAILVLAGAGLISAYLSLG